MHTITKPSILYFGTPVVLISTVNEDGSCNLAPISSVFWLGWRCIIGISALSKTTQNLLRTKECVLNLPSVNEVDAVNRLALTTGSNPVPEGKSRRGYRYESSKFEIAGLTAGVPDKVKAAVVSECPVQMEAKLIVAHAVGDDEPLQKGKIMSIELKIVRVHAEESILMDGYPDRIDPDKWRPLIMSFQQFYSLGKKISPSVLATVPEHLYKTADVENLKN